MSTENNHPRVEAVLKSRNPFKEGESDRISKEILDLAIQLEEESFERQIRINRFQGDYLEHVHDMDVKHDKIVSELKNRITILESEVATARQNLETCEKHIL